LQQHANNAAETIPVKSSLLRNTAYPGVDLVVPPTRLSTDGDRAFPVATAQVWNSLPVPVTSAATLNTFKQRLKTELFIRCYDLPSSYACKHSV